MPHVLDPGYCNNIYNQGYFTTDRDEENKRKDLNKAVGQVSILIQQTDTKIKPNATCLGKNAFYFQHKITKL